MAGIVYQRPIEHIDGIHWWLSLGSNFVLYAAGLCVVSGFRKQPAEVRPAEIKCIDSVAEEPEISRSQSLSRRRLLRATAELTVGGVLGGAFGYSLFWEPSELRITRRTFRIRGLPASLDGLRLAQVSDIHHGPWLSLDHVREVVRRTNALNVDVILLTGDYVYESPVYIKPAIAALEGLRAEIGILATLGNHDWWDHGVPMKRAFEHHGLPLIDNARMVLTPDRRLVRAADDGLCLAGVGDLWEDIPDYHAALAGVPAAMPRLLLAHNPDTAEDSLFLKEHYRVDLMIRRSHARRTSLGASDRFSDHPVKIRSEICFRTGPGTRMPGVYFQRDRIVRSAHSIWSAPPKSC